MASFLGVLGPRPKQASLLWLRGFRDACCLHRVLIYCFSSKQLAIRTGQCFLLNGLIFLGSIFIVNSVVIPTLQWILPDQCPHSGSQKLCSSGGILKLYPFLRLGFLQLFYEI
ncbi:protein EI24 homolog [Camellia sinensis]|uniref:protein EI24 homolog n=1 Tax=Camellia sinensis TaxID=4442 RepID=UPI001036AE08|nr:protein EI24 homolog [Camellia sinensis]